MTNPSAVYDTALHGVRMITDLIEEMRHNYCGHGGTKICGRPVTHWSMYSNGLFARCHIHGILGSGNADNHVSATVDTNGLHINDGDTIDDMLYILCDFCGRPASLQTYHANENGECACNDCKHDMDMVAYDLIKPLPCDGGHKKHSWTASAEIDGGQHHAPGHFKGNGRLRWFMHCRHCGAQRVTLQDANGGPKQNRYSDERLDAGYLHKIIYHKFR